MKRSEIEGKSLKELLELGNAKHGQYESNSLVAREMSRIYNINTEIFIEININL